MVNFDLKYDFIFYLENIEEIEEFNWKILEKIYIMIMNLFILMFVWYMVYVLILDKVVYEIRICLK